MEGLGGRESTTFYYKLMLFNITVINGYDIPQSQKGLWNIETSIFLEILFFIHYDNCKFKNMLSNYKA